MFLFACGPLISVLRALEQKAKVLKFATGRQCSIQKRADFEGGSKSGAGIGILEQVIC